MSMSKTAPLRLKDFIGSAYLSMSNVDYLEFLFEQYQTNPQQLISEWRVCFDQILADTNLSHAAIIQTYFAVDQQRQALQRGTDMTQPSLHNVTGQIQALIDAFRTYGHLQTTLDPLGFATQAVVPALSLEAHDVQAADYQLPITLNGVLNFDATTPIAVLERLKTLYCGNIGFEYQHILDPVQKQWLITQIEQTQANFSKNDRLQILQRLIESEGLEKQFGTQFVAQKRFSVEGGDTLMAMLDRLAIQAAEQGVQSLVLGMGHRGRLNVLINFMGKAPTALFEEFKGVYSNDKSGDVKYHKGFESVLNTPKGSLRALLAYNPSHLEIVNPVVEGIARAQQDQLGDTYEKACQKVLPILMHGDAAIAGQGIVMETFQLSQTAAYGTGGTIHIVSNNQVGFTTDAAKGRSSRYCTDVAKMIEAPIFHVNGDDPEAACRVIQIAMDFRQKFQKDVVIDLVCYRRYGHNEADEPRATQPVMYAKIQAHPPVWKVYAERLVQQGVIQAGEAEKWLSAYQARVAAGQPVAAWVAQDPVVSQANSLSHQDWRAPANTGVAQATLTALAAPLTQLPAGMQLQPQVAKLMADRQKMLQDELPLNWGTAETLAYATLLSEGFGLRLSGQDCERGTFAHRHAVLHDYQTGTRHIPLQALVKSPASFGIYNSILSEAAVMGFEYGYSFAQPKALVIWEAQFGDFVNGAQVVIDQFLSAAEQKWGQQSALVLFLPHGYEGQGPEHSSARPERFLQLCAQNNLQVCMPTTPAQQFHLLRRQLKRNTRKPLVIMTPKSLLRHKQAVSSLTDLATGSFQAVIAAKQPSQSVKRLVLCSGKVYYDLMASPAADLTKVAVIRLEQLYPFPDVELRAALKAYAGANEVIWCQEEPENQGAWIWIQMRLQACLSAKQTLKYVGRSEAASPAAGSPLQHAAEQSALVKAAME
jgi:2-oxoglutarate dehydrogenase E1 component